MPGPADYHPSADYHNGSSAVFASATARFEAEPNRPPELGQFDPAAVVELRRTAPGRSAHGNPASSMASTSDRRLPFEQVSISPSPASYSPRRSEDLKTSRSSRLDLTAPRFRTESSQCQHPWAWRILPGCRRDAWGWGGRGANQGLPRATPRSECCWCGASQQCCSGAQHLAPSRMAIKWLVSWGNIVNWYG